VLALCIYTKLYERGHADHPRFFFFYSPSAEGNSIIMPHKRKHNRRDDFASDESTSRVGKSPDRSRDSNVKGARVADDKTQSHLAQTAKNNTFKHQDSSQKIRRVVAKVPLSRKQHSLSAPDPARASLAQPTSSQVDITMADAHQRKVAGIDDLASSESKRTPEAGDSLFFFFNNRLLS
jgi:hypothetical protein